MLNADSESTFRLVSFLTLLFSFAILEVFFKRRPKAPILGTRWFSNFALISIDTLILRFIFPLGAAGAAHWANLNQVGLLNQVTLLSEYPIAEVVLGILLLDFVIYFQHRLFHRIPIVWRLHRVHHSDVDLDVTSAFRFHPIEILLSMVIKFGIIVAFGLPVQAVILFEIILSSTALFNHSNLALPVALDRIIRIGLVTPDMHRIHHSVVRSETDSNFGFSVPWWDRLFGTYTAEPEKGQLGLEIGLEEFRENQEQKLIPLIVQPFK